MAKHKSNEWEFQGQVLTWVNEQISRRPGLGLDKATQEPSKITPKRSDLVIWWNRAANNAFFTVELKTPEVPINDPQLLNDASEKASRWGAPCFAIWNMQMAELYRTPKTGTATPADRVYQFPMNPLIGSVDDWLDDKKFFALRADTKQIAAWTIIVTPRSMPVVTVEEQCAFSRIDVPQSSPVSEDYLLFEQFIDAATDGECR